MKDLNAINDARRHHTLAHDPGPGEIEKLFRQNPAAEVIVAPGYKIIWREDQPPITHEQNKS